MPSAAGLSTPGVSGRPRSDRGLAAQARGVGAESRVCRILEQEGWTVLRRRARTARGEIDIVAARPEAKLIAFVEVKARRSLSDAALSLSRSQRARLLAAAEILLGQNPEWYDCSLRFDLVVLNATGEVRRVADAFRMGDE